MIFYYGADKIVTNPTYGVGNSNNDYGLGFYMTKEKEMARLWATRFNDGGYFIKYDVDISKLKILYLNHNTNEDVLNWISILINHRFSIDDYENNKGTIDWLKEHYYPNIEDYDMIVGYRADDSYFKYSYDFVANNLSIELLKEAMLIGKLGLQYVLISPKAFKNIKYLSHEKVDKSNEYQTFRLKTLSEYNDLKSKDNINNTYIRDIMRKE